MQWWIALATFGCALAATAALVPVARRLAWKWEILDKPLNEAHKLHTKATPVLGGAAMLVAWVGVILGGYLTLRLAGSALPWDLSPYIRAAHSLTRGLLAVGGGAIAIACVGLYDDIRVLRARHKLLLQAIICAIVALEPRLQITLFWDLAAVRWAMTLLWFLFIINAFNFFDNMDGLASGLAAISAGLFTCVAALNGQMNVSVLGAATAGIALGFYIYNCAPATIFMGDSGSHLLGFLLAAMGAATIFWTPDAKTLAPVLSPLFILALPIFDTFAVIFIRLHLGKPIYVGDHNHISHRFRRLGFRAGTAVLLVHLLALALGLPALLLAHLDLWAVCIIFAQAAVVLALVSIIQTVKPDATT